MHPHAQTRAFQKDLENLVERYAEEFDLDYPSMVGALEIQKAIILSDITLDFLDDILDDIDPDKNTDPDKAQ